MERSGSIGVKGLVNLYVDDTLRIVTGKSDDVVEDIFVLKRTNTITND